MQRVQRMAACLPWESIACAAVPLIAGMLLIQIRVMDTLCPFAVAFCAALYQTDNAGLYASLGCALGLLISGTGTHIITAWAVCGLSIAYVAAGLFGYRIRKERYAVLFFALLLSGVLNSLSSPYMFLIALIDGILAAILRQAMLIALDGLALIRDKQPLTGMQTLSLGILVCAVVMGTGGMTFLTLNTMHILLASMCMVLALCVPEAVCGCFGIAVGCLAALCGGASIQIVSNIGLCSLLSGFCARLGKFGATLGFLLTNALFTFCFRSAAPSLHLGEAMIAALVCVLIPQHAIDTLCALVCHHVATDETARARMVSHAASQRIKAVAAAFEKTSYIMDVQSGREAPNIRLAQRQLDLAAQELQRTASVVEKTETFDAATERAVMHRLMLCGIEPVGCAAQKTRDGLVVRVDVPSCGAKGLCRSTIQRAVSDACGAPMSRSKAPCQSSHRRECSLKYVKKQPVTVKGGVATAKRRDARVCGDVVSACKLSHGRELFCLCDGMGSGEKAREAASMAVELIESYFAAGYSQDQVLITVNQLLMLRKSEVFAAADILLIDTEKMNAMFVKTCAAPSFLIRDATVYPIEMGALPIGVVDDVQPAQLKRRIKPNDCIVMMSDGVSDALQGENVQQIIQKALYEPDESRAANALVEFAQRKLGNMHDDMTAVVLRIE